MCHPRWWCTYNLYYGKDDTATRIFEKIRSTHPNGCPAPVGWVSKTDEVSTDYPILQGDTPAPEYDVMATIKESPLPIVQGEPLSVAIHGAVHHTTNDSLGYCSGLHFTGLQNTTTLSQNAKKQDSMSQFSSGLDHQQTCRYADVKRLFDDCYNMCSSSEDNVNALVNALTDITLQCTSTHQDSITRTDKSVYVSYFPPVERKRKNQ